MDQSQALKILKSGANVFLTGSAGTGKTYLLNEFIGYLKDKGINVGVTASTGIAATHLNGRTIHSWAGIGINTRLDKKALMKLARKEELVERIQRCRVLIIDEISMLDASRLNLVDKVCRAFKNPFTPFGGLQIVLCGDFFQLPPVEAKEKCELAYNSSSWQNSGIKICYLEKQFRQNDQLFVNILNKIRANQAGEDELNLLKTRLYQPVDCSHKPTKLYTHNQNVDAINSYELARIPEEESVFYMSERGPKELTTFLKKNCLAPEELKLKIGAVVMFIKNNFDAGYVNGTLGKVIGFNSDGYPIVKTKNNGEIPAVSSSWSIEEDDEIIASISQVPLRLAWAITVHKSQGMSLDAAEIDLSKSFERGMGYVALSRVRTLKGIRLMGINNMALKVQEEVVVKDREFRKLSR